MHYYKKTWKKQDKLDVVFKPGLVEPVQSLSFYELPALLTELPDSQGELLHFAKISKEELALHLIWVADPDCHHTCCICKIKSYVSTLMQVISHQHCRLTVCQVRFFGHASKCGLHTLMWPFASSVWGQSGCRHGQVEAGVKWLRAC